MATPALAPIERPDGREAFDVPTYLSANATLTKNVRHIVDASGGAVTLTLPTGCAVGDVIWVHRVLDATNNALTINPGASGSFAGTSDTSITLAPLYRVGFRWKSTNVWEVFT